MGFLDAIKYEVYFDIIPLRCISIQGGSYHKIGSALDIMRECWTQDKILENMG